MENTTEKNKLIAEFMGLELEETLNKVMVYAIEISRNNPKKLNDRATEFFEANELKYHTSWDWLIPVVDKIENTFIDGDKPIITIQQGLCEIELWKYDEPNYFQGNSKLESTHQCVVAFIEWYNKLNQQSDEEV